MKGEPTGGTLAEARLLATSCEKASTEQADARIKEMRAAVDQSFKEWHDGQPECWAQDRAEYAWKKQVAEAYGAGGLGLRGVGEGGGGYGEGIGLGSIGTIGHGAGVGASDVSGRAPRTARSASGTNNQVAGVDEADIVKTDGRYVYLAMNGALRIVEAMKPRVVSVHEAAGHGARALRRGRSCGRLRVERQRRASAAPTATTASSPATARSTRILVVRRRESRRAEARARRSICPARSWPRGASATPCTPWSPTATRLAAEYETWPADLDDVRHAGVDRCRAKFARLKAENERTDPRASRVAAHDPREQASTAAALRRAPAHRDR